MTMTTVAIPPGVVTDFPDHDAAGRWVDGNRIRFRDGRLQNMGSWSQWAYSQTTGIARALQCWTLLSGLVVVAVATESKVFVYRSGERYDITPLRASGTLGSNPLSVTVGETTLVISQSEHGCAIGDHIALSGAGTLGNVDPNGSWIVTAVGDSTIEVDTGVVADNTVAGGGDAIAFQYDISPGFSSNRPAAGWGTNAFGSGSWGSANASVTAWSKLRIWWLEPWGEDLLLCHVGGSIWRWRPSEGLTTRAALITEAPQNNTGIFVSAEDRHLIVFGAGADPLALQWPNQGTLTQWTPGVSSTANTLRVTSGSKIVSAMKVASEALIWTDNALFGLRYVGASDYSHALRRISGYSSLVSPKAIAERDAYVYWMGFGDFFIYDGSVRRLPCSIGNLIFSLIDYSQIDKVISSSIGPSHEIVWFFPTKGTGENTHYVKYGISDQSWDCGELSRSAMITNGPSGAVIASAPDRFLYRHEAGPVEQHIEVTLRCRKYATSSHSIDFGPYRVDPDTTTIRLRARGRHVALRIAGAIICDGDRCSWSAETSSFTVADGDQVMRINRMIPDVVFRDEQIRIGSFRFDVEPDGEQ